jgi:hypothetical protein
MGQRHFAEIDGKAVLLQGVQSRGSLGLAGYVELSDLTFVPGVGWTGYTPVARTIDYARRPSLHKCDARCTNAKGHKCECSCGGANHGRGR